MEPGRSPVRLQAIVHIGSDRLEWAPGSQEDSSRRKAAAV
jgi:hypothetical protein